LTIGLGLVVTFGLFGGCGSSEPVEAPMTLSPRFASADGVPIAFSIEGIGAPALLFIHDWSADQGYWAGQVEAFFSEHRVVTLDLAGHGASGAERESWSVEAFAADVRAVIEGLGLPQVVLVGHAMGAVVAVEVARAMPERVVGIVAVDGLHDVLRERQPDAWERLLAAFAEDFPGTCDRFVRAMFTERADGELVRRVAADMCAAPPQIATDVLRQLSTFDDRTALESVRVPVRVINSATPPTNFDGHRALGCDFDGVVLQGLGHFPMLEDPGRFDRALSATVLELTQPAFDSTPGAPI
jgi:pimeloyl-ACP methyl ester carboxylesterase